MLAAEYDWSESELGPREQWAPAVEAVVSAVLEATVPMAYCHGAGYAIVYNDRFADVLGANHPRAWGQRVAVVLPEIWSRPGLAELFDEVFAGGPSFHDDGEMLGLNGERPTGPGAAYFVRSCSAVRDSDGSVLGVVVRGGRDCLCADSAARRRRTLICAWPNGAGSSCGTRPSPACR